MSKKNNINKTVFIEVQLSKCRKNNKILIWLAPFAGTVTFSPSQVHAHLLMSSFDSNLFSASYSRSFSIEDDDSVRIPKNHFDHLADRSHRLRLLWGWFAWWCPLFRRLLCLRHVKLIQVLSTVMYWRINSIGLRRKEAKPAIESVTWSRLFSMVSKRGTHLFINNFSCVIVIVMPCDMPITSTISRTFLQFFRNRLLPIFWAPSGTFCKDLLTYPRLK